MSALEEFAEACADKGEESVSWKKWRMRIMKGAVNADFDMIRPYRTAERQARLLSIFRLGRLRTASALTRMTRPPRGILFMHLSLATSIIELQCELKLPRRIARRR